MDRNEYENILKFLQGKLDTSHWNRNDILRIKKTAKNLKYKMDTCTRRKKMGSYYRSYKRMR